MEHYIPKELETKLDEILRSFNVPVGVPQYKAIMALVQKDVTPAKRWVYNKKGEGRIVEANEGKKLLDTGNFADHPKGPLECKDGGRCWEEKEQVKRDKAYMEALEEEAEDKTDTFYTDETPDEAPTVSMDNSRDELIAHAVGMGLNPGDKDTKQEILNLIENN